VVAVVIPVDQLVMKNKNNEKKNVLRGGCGGRGCGCAGWEGYYMQTTPAATL
jgi:hypothetical protein